MRTTSSTGLALAGLWLFACVVDVPFLEPDDGGVVVEKPDAGHSADLSALPDGDVGLDLTAPPDALPACPSFAAGMSLGRTPPTILTEASGIVESRRSPGTLWLHNDSGAGPRIVALAKTGAAQAIYDLAGASARDWEDLALGPGPVRGQSYLYIGDIGDNGESRASIDIYRVAEPDVTMGSTTPSTLDRKSVV